MQMLEHEPVMAGEQPMLEKIERLLASGTSASLLVGPEREAVELPGAVFQVVQQIVHHMAQGGVAFVLSEEQMLTTQEAADILDVSRPYIIKLLNQGGIPFVKVGTHRRIRSNDLMSFKKRLEHEQDEAIAKLARMSQELGLYD